MSTTTVQRLRPDGLYRSPAFSHVVVVPPGATTVLVGGQDAVDADGQIVGDDVGTQTAKILDNVETALAAAGATLDDVVQWRIYAVQGVDLGAGYAEFQRRVNPDLEPPLVTAALVAALAVPGALVEIEALAVV